MGERTNGHIHWDTRVARRRKGRQRVVAIERAGNIPLHSAHGAPGVHHLEGFTRPFGPHGPVAPRAKSLDGRPAAPLKYASERRIRRIHHQATARGHSAHEVMELRLDGCQVRKDIRVVELEVVENRRARPIPDELRALVEKGGVVLVGLDHEEGRIREPRGNAEVARHATDQESGVEAGGFQDPGEHRRGCGLSMGASHGKHPLSREYILGEPLRPRGITQVSVEHGLNHGLAPRHGIADHADVRRVAVQLLGVVALVHRHAQVAELVAHRGIDLRITAGDGVARFASDLGKPAHERAGDTENVQLHGRKMKYTAPTRQSEAHR